MPKEYLRFFSLLQKLCLQENGGLRRLNDMPGVSGAGSGIVDVQDKMWDPNRGHLPNSLMSL